MAAFALLLGWSSASAQSWTGNAPAESTTFYLYNVGQQKFLTSGNWWGTHAALDTDGMPVTLTASEGAYKIFDTAVSFGTSKGLGGNEYVDNDSPVAWTFTQIGSTGKYTLKNGSNYFVSNGNGVPVNTTTEPTTDDGYWQLVTKNDLIANLNNATPENPIDASFYMTNPRVRRNWPKSISGTGLNDNGSFNASAEGLYAGGCTSYGQWHKTFDNYQSLSGIKKGKYKVRVKGVNRVDEGYTAEPYLYANSVKGANFHTIVESDYSGQAGTEAKDKVTHLFVDNTYLLDWLEVTVTDGNLRVGVKSDGNVGWSTFAQFELMFVEPFISDLATESFTSGSTMEANQWYTFTVSTDGDYTLSTTDGIVYAAEDKLASEAGAITSSIALKAGTVYYLKSSTTQTLTVNFVEPVVANGDYYLYDETNKVFLSRGNHYGTQASIDPYGIPFTYNNYEKSLRFKDWSSAGLFYNGSEYFTDGGTPGKFIFETTEGGFYFKDQNNSKYLKNAAGSETRFGNNCLVQATSTSDATVWTLKTKEEHDAIVATYSTDNKTSVIASAGISTTAEDFESYLATNLAAKDKTTSVGTYNFDGNAAGDWTWTTVESRSGGAINYADKVAEAYLNTGFWTQTVEGLQPGIYKVGVNAFERETSYATCNTLGAEGYEIVTAYFEANGEKVQLKSWYSEKTGTNNPDSRAQSYTAFFNDKYKNEVYAYVADGGDGTGTLTLKVAKPAYADRSWVLFNNITLTFYDTNVSDDDATAILGEAATTMESPMKHSLYEALSTAKETFDGSRTVPNYNALRTAIDNTATSIASYANMYTNYLEPLNSYLATTNFIDESSDGYSEYAGYKDSYDNYKTTGADVENATANSLSWSSGGRYVTAVTKIFAANWKNGETAALTDGSGFYINNWSTESAGEAPAKDFANPFYEYWVGSGSLAATTLTGTLTGLSANTAYDVTANVRVQGSSKVAGSITMEVVGGVPVDVTAGDQIGETARYIKNYTATGVTDGDGNLVLKFNVAANSNISWLAFRDVNYSVSATAASNNFIALNSAISTAEGKTLGFETGEYAPYNNIDGIEALAIAKAFDQDRYYTPAAISAAATALTGVTWTANVTQVNAFYKGDFDGYAEDTSSPLDYTPNGWTATDNFRVMIKNEENYPGLAVASAGTAAMSWSGGITYGETAGYTMPLKANTVYRLQFKAAGWNNETRSGMSVSILNGSDGMALYNLGTPDRDIKGNATNTAGMTSYDVVFATGAAGNYVFHIQSGHNMVLTDFSITKAASQILEFTDGSAVPTYAPGTYPSVTITRTLTANRWATAVYPFAISDEDVDNIAVLDSYDSETGELGFTSAAASTANVPFLMMSESGATEISLRNVVVAATAGNPVATKSEASLNGAYKATAITNAEKNYVLSDNQIFSVGTAGATINPYRAYIQIEQPSEARALKFVVDGQITGIGEVEAAEAVVKDGKFFKNGKLFIMKNGKKYGATGAQIK